MAAEYFAGIDKIRYEGPESDNPLAFRFYNPDRQVLGKRMEDHLRMAVAYWHSFCWPGNDVFGGPTFDRPWQDGDTVENAERKLDAAFEFFEKLGVRSSASTTLDMVPLGETLAEGWRNLDHMVRGSRTGMRASGGAAAVGHGEPVRPPPLHGRRRDQPGPAGLRLCRRPGGEDHGGHAPPGWRQLRPVGRARGIRDPAQHRHAAGRPTSSAGS